MNPVAQLAADIQARFQMGYNLVWEGNTLKFECTYCESRWEFRDKSEHHFEGCPARTDA